MTWYPCLCCDGNGGSNSGPLPAHGYSNETVFAMVQEIARLRGIEEAAQNVLRCCGTEETWGWPDRCPEHNNLRAALKAEQ